MRFDESASASPRAQTLLQTRLNRLAFLCYRLLDLASLEEVAIVEPPAVVVHSVRKVAPEAN